MMRLRMLGGWQIPLKSLSDRRLERAVAAGVVVAAMAGLSACSAVGDLFHHSPETAVTAMGPDTSTKVEVGHLPGDTSIPVLANDQPITRYDINQRAALMQIGGMKGGTKAATDELIDETLKMYEAAKRGVSVPQARVDAAYASIAKHLKLTPDGLTKALASRGIAAASLKKRLRAQMTWAELVRAKAQATAQVTNADVTSAMMAKGNSDIATSTEYTLQQIVFVVPPGSPNALYVQRRHEAEAFRTRFAGCDNSLHQASALRGVVVKDIGRRMASELVGPQGEAIKKTPVGRTAPPFQSDSGIEVIAVCSTRDIQSTALARAQVESELMQKQSEGLGKDYLKELRDRAIIEYR